MGEMPGVFTKAKIPSRILEKKNCGLFLTLVLAKYEASENPVGNWGCLVSGAMHHTWMSTGVSGVLVLIRCLGESSVLRKVCMPALYCDVPKGVLG